MMQGQCQIHTDVTKRAYRVAAEEWADNLVGDGSLLISRSSGFMTILFLFRLCLFFFCKFVRFFFRVACKFRQARNARTKIVDLLSLLAEHESPLNSDLTSRVFFIERRSLAES